MQLPCRRARSWSHAFGARHGYIHSPMGKPPPSPPRPRDDPDDDLIPLAVPPAPHPKRAIDSAVPMANLAPPPMAMMQEPWLGSPAASAPQRPGLVTAIGVLSIVLGSLAALGE